MLVIKSYFFLKNCPSFSLMIGDFSLKLSASIVKKAWISIVEDRMNQAYKIVNHLDTLESDYILELF